MSEFKLIEEIVARSEASNWDRAKLEWSLFEVYKAEKPDNCLCGHFPIIEICILENRLTGQFAKVGNSCVKKFIGLPSDKIFQAVRRVKKDSLKSLNAEAIEYAFEKRWIDEWEKNFYFDIMRKRNLSEKQATRKAEINEKVVLCIMRPVITK